MDESAIAKEILNWLQVSKDFIAEQAPLLAQEILRWGVASYTLGLVVNTLVFLLLMGLSRYCWGQHRKDPYAEWPMTACVLLGMSGLILLIPITVNLAGLIKVLVSPRLYLIEQLARFIN